ncbi:MAG: thioredoxin domain-containing protein [Elusimicrobia bacterium]|nr:thioredoxin domain-containing protein [Elusimicrobiota bacterium]
MNRFAAAALCAALASPSLAAVSREELQKALDDNPDLVLSALKKSKKAEFFQLVIDSQREYQIQQAQQEQEREKRERDAAFKTPYKPAIDAKTRVRGSREAPITVVEYADFQCPPCGRSYPNVEQVRRKYGAKMRFVFKHMPLSELHPQARPAAQWMEAVTLQSPEKAWLFHDKMFSNQDKLGEDFYRKTVKDLGLDPAKAAQDAKSKAVQSKIDADIEEGRQFGFAGTPGFLVNGVPLRGAYPPAAFDEIIADPRLGVKL